jgi:tetratricopeptide (TPR) repeat protein
MRKRHYWLACQLLLYTLLGVCLSTVVVTGRFWWQEQHNRPLGNAATLVELKDKLEAYDKRADDLEKLLTLLLGVSTIYAIALGLSAYQQLKDSAEKLEGLRKEAQKKIDQLPGELVRIRELASDEIEKFAARFLSKLFLFADMDVAFRGIMYRLMCLLPVIDWSDEENQEISPQIKEEILFYEKTVASFEYFDLRRLRQVRESASEIFHGLGNFYALQYAREGKQDWHKERARFYLDRAIRFNPKNVGALNDRGFLATDLDNPPDFATARDVFTKSLDADGEQQRALYNLASVEHREENYRRAADLLCQAIEKKRWQEKLPARHRDSILYNRACAYVRLGVGDAARKPTWFDEAVADLAKVFPSDGLMEAETLLGKNFKNDIKPGEDLHALTIEDPWKSEVEKIKSRLP